MIIIISISIIIITITITMITTITITIASLLLVLLLLALSLLLHNCHIIPLSEIDVGLFWAAFAGLEGKYLFHRIGRKGRIWQL